MFVKQKVHCHNIQQPLVLYVIYKYKITILYYDYISPSSALYHSNFTALVFFYLVFSRGLKLFNTNKFLCFNPLWDQ